MKKALSVLFAISILLCVIIPFSAMGAEKIETPKLDSISFKNATIDSKLSPDIYDYTITLDDPSITPTLKDYKLSSNANIFVNYSLDSNKHQNGIIVTIEHTNGALYYNFMYSNAVSYNDSANNYLVSVNCNIGEVYPAINDEDTSYKLYVPSDITEIQLSAVPKETSAVVEAPGAITLSPDQETVIPLTVTAGNGEARAYSFKVKRLNKTTEEVKAEMADPDFKSIVEGELFYQKPIFTVAVIGSIVGIILLILFIIIAKRLTVKVGDDDEVDFFE